MSRNSVKLLALSVMLSLAGAEASLAGPIEDWLFPRAATTCAPLATDACGTVVTNLPVAGAAPAAPPLALAPATAAASAPGPFRTAWVQVPVTVYKPVATIDPATGATVNTMQACTTHRWQLRRVPVGLSRPAWYASQPTGGAVMAGPFAAPVAAPVWQQGVPATIGPPGCASCQSGAATMYAPQSPAMSAPYAASPSPYQAAPTPSGQPYAPSLTPVQAAPMNSGAVGSPTPADMAPSLLKPSENPLQGPSNAVQKAPTGQAERAGSASEYPILTPSLKPLADPDAYAPQSPPPATNLTPVNQPLAAPQPTSLQGPSLEAPLLLNPNDRSA